MKHNGIFIVVTLAVVLTGCVSHEMYTIDPNQTTFSRADIEAMPEMQFPANYSTNNFTRLRMAVLVDKLEGHCVDQNGQNVGLKFDGDLSTRLQGQFADLKRFTVYSIHNRNGVRVFEDLNDVGEGPTLKKTIPEIDYTLTLKMKITLARNTFGGQNGEQCLVTAECDGNCLKMDTQTVFFAEKTRGREWYEKVAGFDPNEAACRQRAINLAAKKAIVEMVNKIGNYFPVGGKVLDVTPTGLQMALDCGGNQGVGKGQQCLVFIRDRGVDIPLALAEAEEGRDECTLDVYRWNTKDPDARAFIDIYKKAPSTFAGNYQIFAVGYGLPPSKKMNY